MEHNIVESDGDRFADIVENVKLNESLAHVMKYIKDIADTEPLDFEAQTCLEVLESMKANTTTYIGDTVT